MNLSKAEQDYVKVIYDLAQEHNTNLVSLKQLTAQLAVSAPSVTEMAKRIEKKGLIEYQSYKGVRLTSLGNEQALFILKAHRVWEYFLLDVLNYAEDDVHLEAEALEHAVSPQLIERLYDYLGRPERCPHGRPIPQETFWYERKRELALPDVPVGVRGEVLDRTDAFDAYLTTIGVEQVARFIQIDQKLADGTCIVQLNNQSNIVIPSFLQQGISVSVYE